VRGRIKRLSTLNRLPRSIRLRGVVFSLPRNPQRVGVEW
jgi:hypothetical protein